MGNVMRLFKTDRCPQRRVRIMKVDGTITKFSTPLYVKDDEIWSRDLRIVSLANDGSNMRVKIRIRKNELAKFLYGDGNSVADDVVEKAILKKQLPQDSMSRPVGLRWKPSLESIDESHSPSDKVLESV